MYDFRGKVAVVTGGSRGIGRAIVERLAGEGAEVVFTYRDNTEAAREVVDTVAEAGGVAEAVRADAVDPDAARAYVDAALARGGIDMLVHNAGVGGLSTIGELGAEAGFTEFRRQFATNVDGLYAGTELAAPHMGRGGAVVVISSVNAHTLPIAGAAIYGGTKGAVTQMVRGWARDLGPRGIRVNAVQPGPVDTEMNPKDGELAPHFLSRVALPRYAEAREVAAVVAFLCSAEASYITGAAVDVDGGMTV